MSNSLIKLIELSLLPAAILILGKFVGIYLTASLFGLELGFRQTDSVFTSLQPVTSVSAVATLSSYSDLFMFVFVSIGFLVTLVFALYFHDTHFDAGTFAKLVKVNLVSLLRSSYQIYHASVVWLIFTWLSNLVVLFNVVAGSTESWILAVTIVSSLVMTTMLYRDFEKEVELARNHPTFDWK
jgi:hypothetical protein